jgi:hypothetical protein
MQQREAGHSYLQLIISPNVPFVEEDLGYCFLARQLSHSRAQRGIRFQIHVNELHRFAICSSDSGELFPEQSFGCFAVSTPGD